MSKYEYLTQFVCEYEQKKHKNWFGKITQKEIAEAENKIGFQFPESLKEFWLEIGYGFLRSNIKGESVDSGNLIMSPGMVADTILRDEEESAILLHVLEDFLEDGDIPFFDAGNGDYFFKMKLNDRTDINI